MVKERKTKNKLNVFKVSYLAGMMFIVLSLIGAILSNLLSSDLAIASSWSLVQGILVLVFSLVFTFGFYALGKKYNKTLPKVISILIIIFMLVSYFVGLFIVSPTSVDISNIVRDKATSLGLDLNNLGDSQIQTLGSALLSEPGFMTLVLGLLGLLLLYLVVYGILSIFLGISLIKLRKDVKYAKVAGILEIVGGATLIILIGFIPLFIALVYELIILFKESKK